MIFVLLVDVNRMTRKNIAKEFNLKHANVTHMYLKHIYDYKYSKKYKHYCELFYGKLGICNSSEAIVEMPVVSEEKKRVMDLLKDLTDETCKEIYHKVEAVVNMAKAIEKRKNLTSTN